MIKQLSHNLTHNTIWHEQRKLRTSGREAQNQSSFFRIIQDINKKPSETAIWLQTWLSEPASCRHACIAYNLNKMLLNWTELFGYGMGAVRVKTVCVESQFSTKLAGFLNIISCVLMGILGVQNISLQQSSAGSFQQLFIRRVTTNTELSGALSGISTCITGCLLGLNVLHMQWDRSGLIPPSALRGAVELCHQRHYLAILC